MSKILAFILMSILAANGLIAAEQKSAPGAPKTKAPEQAAAAENKAKPADEVVATIALKNKSSFQIDAGTRSPFWPISWKPTGKVSSGGGTDQGEVPPGAFVVSTITLDGGTRFAIINGKSMSEGQTFGLQVGTQIYQVSVKRIEDGRVILGRRDEEIVIPLRRK
jgi:hypothetical protein